MKRFDVYLRNKVTRFAIYLHEIPIRKDIGVRHHMVLTSKAVNLMMGVLFSPSAHRMVLRNDVQSTHLTVYEKVQSAAVLSSSVMAHIGTFANGLKNNMVLSSSDVTASAEKFASAEGSMILKSSSAAISVDSVARFDHGLVLSSKIRGSFVDKFASISHGLMLTNQLLETIVLFAKPIESEMVLSHSIRATLSRYRLLYEMDDLPLSEFDDMELQIVDFVEID